MALLSELVAVCADQRVDSPATLGMFSRRLRESGRISKAGRGRGAAQMTFLDAARFLVACAATDHPEQAADAEFQFSNMVWSNDGVYGTKFQLTAETAPTLDAALARVLEAIADGSIGAAQLAEDRKRDPQFGTRIPPIFSLIVFRGAVSARLRVLDGNYMFQHPTLAAIVAAKDYQVQKPLTQAFERETHRFRSGKNLMAELDASLLRAVADLISNKGTEDGGY